jgi:hypothetical protein
MRELDAIEITAASLEPESKQTLILAQPYPDTILLSHFEVTDLTPPSSSVELTDLRIERLSYLIAPVPLSLIQREQCHAQARAERQRREQLQRLVRIHAAAPTPTIQAQSSRDTPDRARHPLETSPTTHRDLQKFWSLPRRQNLHRVRAMRLRGAITRRQLVIRV